MKKFMRMISLILICVMALCLFTACESNNLDPYIAALGASDNIQQSNELDKIAVEYISTGFENLTASKSVKDNKAAIIKAINSFDTKDVKVDGCFFDVNIFGYTVTGYLGGDGKEITDSSVITKSIAGMNYYGIASKKLYGNHITVNVVTFAK